MYIQILSPDAVESAGVPDPGPFGIFYFFPKS
jgi:hypothetical protein